MTNYKTKLNYYWLAGLIDGDGYFYLSKANYGCFELTVASGDRHMLEDIRKEFNGRIKPRAGTASVRLRVHNKVGLLGLLHAVNGRLQNSVRQKQFETVALAYGVNTKPTQAFSWQNGYFSGLFDADGKITIGVKNLQFKGHSTILLQEQKQGPKTYGKIMRLTHSSNSQLTIGVTSKYRHCVDFLCTDRFGKISYDRSQNGYYTWYVTSQEDIGKLLQYFERYPPRSSRKTRVNLIPAYFNFKKKIGFGEGSDQDLSNDERKAYHIKWSVFVKAWFEVCN